MAECWTIQFGQAEYFIVGPIGVGSNIGYSQIGQNGISNFGPGSSQFGQPMLSQFGRTKNVRLTGLSSKGTTNGLDQKQQKGRPDANTAVNEDIKKTHVGIYMANPST